MTTWRKEDQIPQPMSPAENTLRLIASLPAPEGLVDRVQAELRSAPRSGRVLRWPVWIRGGEMLYANALRGAAAAVIVFMVAGGGWQIYSHVKGPTTAQAVPTALPSRVGNGFSTAGAMRTPGSPDGPALTHAVTPTPQTRATDAKAEVRAESESKHAKKHKKAAPAVVPQR